VSANSPTSCRFALVVFVVASSCGGRVEHTPGNPSFAGPDAATDTGAGQSGFGGGATDGGSGGPLSGSAAGAGAMDAEAGGTSGTAGAAGVGGSSGASGASGAGGAAAVCDYLAGDEPACRPCILEHCYDPCALCESDAACTLFLVCFLHCADDLQSCLASCADDEPDGAAGGSAFILCMRQQRDSPCTWCWG
jgi:hypothetical protein